MSTCRHRCSNGPVGSATRRACTTSPTSRPTRRPTASRPRTSTCASAGAGRCSSPTLLPRSPTSAARCVPRARLVLLVWQGYERNEWATAIRDALTVGYHRARADAPSSTRSPWRTQRSRDAVLTAAGFSEVSFTDVDEPVFYGPDTADRLRRGASASRAPQDLLADLDATAADARARTTARHPRGARHRRRRLLRSRGCGSSPRSSGRANRRVMRAGADRIRIGRVSRCGPSSRRRPIRQWRPSRDRGASRREESSRRRSSSPDRSRPSPRG